jgi:succinyl-CoA synthetase beta subunit
LLGIIAAAKIVGLKKTLVVRMSGTNSLQGQKILNDFSASNSNFKILTASNLDEAAIKAVGSLKK